MSDNTTPTQAPAVDASAESEEIEAISTVACGYCGAETLEDEVFDVHGSRSENHTGQVCEGCLDAHYTRVSGRHTVCGDTLFVREGSGVTLAGGDDCTQAWADENTGCCDRCGDRRENDYMYCDSYGDGSYCEDCMPPPPGKIKDYHASNPTALGYFSVGPTDGTIVSNYHAVDGVRYFGWELEVQPRKGSVSIDTIVNEDMAHLESFSTFERDGSVRGGVEIISAPHTLEAAQHRLADPDYRGALSRVKSHNTSCCGLHVHVSRAGLSREHVTRMRTFVCAPRNQAFIDAIAQRGENTYSVRNVDEESRYCAVNSENEHTIEIRIFRGNIRPERIAKAIEFTAALVAFSSATAWYSLNHADFADYVCTKQAMYPALWAYMVERGIQGAEQLTLRLPEIEAADPAMVPNDEPGDSYVHEAVVLALQNAASY